MDHGGIYPVGPDLLRNVVGVAVAPVSVLESRIGLPKSRQPKNLAGGLLYW